MAGLWCEVNRMQLCMPLSQVFSWLLARLRVYGVGLSSANPVAGCRHWRCPLGRYWAWHAGDQVPIQARTLGLASSLLHGSGKGLPLWPAMVQAGSAPYKSAMLCMEILDCYGQLCNHRWFHVCLSWTGQGISRHSKAAWSIVAEHLLICRLLLDRSRARWRCSSGSGPTCTAGPLWAAACSTSSMIPSEQPRLAVTACSGTASHAHALSAPVPRAACRCCAMQCRSSLAWCPKQRAHVGVSCRASIALWHDCTLGLQLHELPWTITCTTPSCVPTKAL